MGNRRNEFEEVGEAFRVEFQCLEGSVSDATVSPSQRL